MAFLIFLISLINTYRLPPTIDRHLTLNSSYIFQKPLPMRVAHLIVTYTNPEQTERMIKRMQHPDFDFYIHVDAKMPISSHDNVAKIPNVFLIKIE